MQTGTAFQIIGYRYSTEGFYSLSDTTYKQMSGTVIDPDTLNEKTMFITGMIFIICVITKEESFRQIYRNH